MLHQAVATTRVYTQFHLFACKNNIKCYFFIGARFPLSYVAGRLVASPPHTDMRRYEGKHATKSISHVRRTGLVTFCNKTNQYPFLGHLKSTAGADGAGYWRRNTRYGRHKVISVDGAVQSYNLLD